MIYGSLYAKLYAGRASRGSGGVAPGTRFADPANEPRLCQTSCDAVRQSSPSMTFTCVRSSSACVTLGNNILATFVAPLSDELERLDLTHTTRMPSTHPLQYAPWTSDIELAFYSALASIKINHDKLDSSARKVLGVYEINHKDPPERSTRMQIHGTALTTDE